MEGQAHVIKTRSYILSVSGQLVTQVFLQDNNKFHTAVGYNRNTTIYLRSNTKHAGVSKIAIFDTPA